MPINNRFSCFLLSLALAGGAVAAGQLDTGGIFGNSRSTPVQGNVGSGFSGIFGNIAAQTVNTVRAFSAMQQRSAHYGTTPLYAPADARLTVFPAENAMRFTLDNGNVIEYRDIRRFAPEYTGASGTRITAGTYVGELSASADKQNSTRTLTPTGVQSREAPGNRFDLVFSETITNLRADAQKPSAPELPRQSVGLPTDGNKQNNTFDSTKKSSPLKGKAPEPTIVDHNDKSKLDLVKEEMTRRMTDLNWAIQLTEAHPRSITIEIARIRAANLWLDQQIAERKERIEAIYAIIMALQLRNSH